MHQPSAQQRNETKEESIKSMKSNEQIIYSFVKTQNEIKIIRGCLGKNHAMAREG